MSNASVGTESWGKDDSGNCGDRGGVLALVRMGDKVTGAQPRGWETGARMTASERKRYVYWWLKQSGLTPRELRRIATGIWSDRVFDETSSSTRIRAG